MEHEIERKQTALRSPWVWGWLGLLGSFLVANGIMVYLSVTHSPQLVVKDYYEKGRKYEREVLTRLAKNKDWLGKIKAPEFVKVKEANTFRYLVTDKEGHPIRPESVVFHAYRPSDASLDFAVPMREEQKGRYVAEITFPLKGAWDVIVSAKHGDGEFNTSYRVMAGVDLASLAE